MGVRVLAVASVLALATTGIMTGADAQQPSPFPPDTLAVGLTDGDSSGIQVALALSRATFADDGSDVVLIGRDDLFADSLSAGVAQVEGPLLLVGTTPPVDADVTAEIARLGASRAVILGGTSAVSAAVEDDLVARGLAVTRLSGVNRVQTAVAVAQEIAPAADTAILARASGVAGNPSSSFADALAAGGWAAANRWPVLLTQTDILSDATAEYLAASAVRTVKVMGGTAAINEAVTDQLRELGLTVDRIAGPDRVATAVAVAQARGADTAAELAEVIVVDGYDDTAWTAGFAVAARSARGAAPIVLANSRLDTPGALPPATLDWLAPGPERLTCATSADACERARLALGFEPALLPRLLRQSITFTASDGSSSGVHAAMPDGTPLGQVHTCGSAACTQLDWSAGGESLAVMEVGRGVLELSGTNLTLHDTSFIDEEVTLTGMAASEDVDFPHLGAAFAVTDGRPRIATRPMVGAQLAQGQAVEDDLPLSLPSFQVFNRHPDYRADVGAMIFATASGRLMVKGVRDDGRNETVDAHLQPRPAAMLIGAAWAPTGSGAIALVDAVDGVGVLRYAGLGDGQPTTVAGLDVTGPPVWTTDGQAILVMARGAEGTALVEIDVNSGASQVLLPSTGAASGARIDADASAMIIAWPVEGVIRVLDRAGSSVSTIAPPPGFTLSGGPSIRP